MFEKLYGSLYRKLKGLILFVRSETIHAWYLKRNRQFSAAEKQSIMKQSVYIETTVVSYLTAWRSPQLVMAAHQEATKEWWDNQRAHFNLFVSESVIQEASVGDPEAADKRLEVIKNIPELRITEDALDLARSLINKGGLPSKAGIDALHISVASANGMDYLLTWNCRHIANATLQKVMRTICEDAGYLLPIICTPLELIEEYKND